MIIRFPVVPDRWGSAFGNQLMAQLQKAFGLVVSQDEETPRIVLRSPTGKLFDVTVDDAGVLHTSPTSKSRV